MPRRALAVPSALVIVLAAACKTAPVPPSPPTRPPPPVDAAVDAAPPPPEAIVVPDGVRLPRKLAIDRGALDLAIDPAQATFTGRARFEGTMTADGAVIWLHAENLTITRATVALAVTPEPPAGAKPGPPPMPLEVVTGLARGRVALRSAWPLLAGNRYTLELEYTASLDAVETAGTFHQQLDGRWYVYTQHESIFARRSFPCLDEPDLKIPWTITITAPADTTAVSNAPETSVTRSTDGRRVFAFAPTTPLPSYLVAYAVGPFEIVPAGTSRGGAPIRIITPAGKAAEAAFAAEATPKILAALEDWFRIPYPFAKLDSLTIPTTVGFSAMENAGLISYTERALLMPADAPEARKRRYVGIGAHEMAHQWFGDLVTPVWWDDIWLNESFASWLPGKVIGDVYPTYRRAEDDAVGRGGALGNDALSTARRIRQPVEAEDDIVNAFDGISYGKGATVLRMMEAWAGPDGFREGVRAYLQAHAHGNATSADFVAAIAAHTEAPGVEAAFASFLDQAGAPRIEARIECKPKPSVRLTQRRYVALGATTGDATTRWTLPICVVAGGAATERVCGVMTGDELRLDLARCPTWVWPNADGKGYFRSAMSASAWTALRGGWSKLSAGERLAAAQDLLAAVSAGDVTIDVALDWLPALLGEKSAPATAIVADVVGGARPWIPPAARGKLAAWVDRHLGERARALGWLRRDGDTIDDEDIRDRIVPLASVLGDRELGRAAVELSRDWRALPEGPRRAVLQAAVRLDPATADRLLSDFRTEKVHAAASDLAAAVGVVRDPARLALALALVTDPSVDVRDAIPVLGAALSEDETRAVAEPFIVEHLDEILARLPDEWGAGQVNLLTTSCDYAKVAPMRALAEAKLAGRRGARRRIDQAFERMAQCVAQRSKSEAPLKQWLTRAK